MPELKVGGDRLHFFDEGSGATVVFIHGSCGGGTQWKRLSSVLQQNYRTIRLDLFGCGQSQPWPIERKWTVEDDERAINAVLDFLEGPVHMVVHSGGGHSAYPTIKSRRDLILSLTLFEPVYFHLLRQAGDPLIAEPEGMANDYRAAMNAGNREKAIEGFVDMWARAEGTWHGLPDSVKDMMRRGADRLYHEWLNVWREEPTRDDLAALDLPVLLFKGTCTIPSMDRVCEMIAQAVPDCHYVEIDGAGHMSPFTHASEALPTLKEHLAPSEPRVWSITRTANGYRWS